MLNRRKLIQIALSELATERPYFDFKRSIDLSTDAGRGRLIQDIASLANTNRSNPAFIIVGVDDTTRSVIGTVAIDDVRLQQLVREYLRPRLHILYEAVPFPHSASDCALGLLTIHPAGEPVSIARRIWKLREGARYLRDGSENRPVTDSEDSGDGPHVLECNELVATASVQLEDTLTEFLTFYRTASPSYQPAHMVYRDQHVVCYSGWSEDRVGMHCLSEVRVELLTEGVSLFWSAVEHVTLITTPDRFTVCEHALLFWNDQAWLQPFQETSLVFAEGGAYGVDKSLVFVTPTVTQQDIAVLLKDYEDCLSNVNPEATRARAERGCWENFPSQLLLATLNGSDKARTYLEDYMSGRADGASGEALSEALALLRLLENR